MRNRSFPCGDGSGAGIFSGDIPGRDGSSRRSTSERSHAGEHRLRRRAKRAGEERSSSTVLGRCRHPAEESGTENIPEEKGAKGVIAGRRGGPGGATPRMGSSPCGADCNRCSAPGTTTPRSCSPRTGPRRRGGTRRSCAGHPPGRRRCTANRRYTGSRRCAPSWSRG